MGRRRKAREVVLQVLYACEIGEEPIEQVLDDRLSGEDYEEDLQEFARRLAMRIDQEREGLDAIIAERAVNWDLGRIALIDKLILRMGLCELLHFPDIPRKVCINESIEMTKKYSSSDAKRFVNGILDSIYQEMVEKTT
ncbi:transcription antitermination factor NusB [Candidatus Zixiibacteriota bacterium]